MLKIQRNSKGFTLIELLIVIAIIGILAAIAIPSYTGYVKRAKVQEVVHAIGAVKTAVMAYYTEQGAVNPNLTSVAAINTLLGVNVPDKYLSAMSVQGNNAFTAGDGAITATFNAAGTNTATQKSIGTGVDSRTIILRPDAALKLWTWDGASSIDSAYLPKNN